MRILVMCFVSLVAAFGCSSKTQAPPPGGKPATEAAPAPAAEARPPQPPRILDVKGNQQDHSIEQSGFAENDLRLDASGSSHQTIITQDGWAGGSNNPCPAAPSTPPGAASLGRVTSCRAT